MVAMDDLDGIYLHLIWADRTANADRWFLFRMAQSAEEVAVNVRESAALIKQSNELLACAERVLSARISPQG
jgi:hypothetical protein